MGGAPLYLPPSIYFDTEIPGGFEIGIGVLAEHTALYDALIIEDGEDLVIVRFEIAGEMQIDTAVPAIAFAPDPRPPYLRLGSRRGPGIYAGMSVDLTVRNLAPDPRRFRARITVLPWRRP